MSERKPLSNEIVEKVNHGLNVEYYGVVLNRKQLMEQNKKNVGSYKFKS